MNFFLDKTDFFTESCRKEACYLKKWAKPREDKYSPSTAFLLAKILATLTTELHTGTFAKNRSKKVFAKLATQTEECKENLGIKFKIGTSNHASAKPK